MPFRPSHRQLEYVVALAEAGHFGVAARRCHVSQPTLSVQIAQLEQNLGTPLFDRTPGRIVPTAVGARIVATARNVLLELDEIVAVAAGGARNLGGLIRLGVAPTFGPYFFPALLPALHARYPGLELYIREERPALIEREVMEGRLDCGLGPLPASGHALTFRRLCRETIFLGVPKDHRFALGGPLVPVSALRGERLLTLGRGHQLFESARDLAAASGADMREDYEGTSLDALWQMVLMGMGLSLFPELYALSELGEGDDMVLLRLAGWPARREIGYFWRASNGRAPQFEQLARESDATRVALGLSDCEPAVPAG
ncbi:hydrogen peroxide-inducible genes activator [Aquabacter spiritensis]|uniref:LysR family transcriptional regulator n=1 Tax=Aquabacter spiritensis TaxID=933073 RepID=A0A4R3MA50_9HYPH|nr:hydrogen peroxide-inducible genes activator [Aquabacter spiritensis]TCT08275.1 LysR family transcriptional regulator [Aquabacter spiritensis]